MIENNADILTQVRNAANQRILFLPHALNQMNRPDRMISPDEVRATVMQGELIEEYPEDVRGYSCLLLGQNNRFIHVVCAPKTDYLAIITAYLPDLAKWESDGKTRKGRS